MATLIPTYLDIDFNTLVAKIKEELQNDATFADYNYEGSNISILIELMAYIGELNTYYLNKIAKNIYIDTADIYENVNKLGRMIGYEAKGYTSSVATLSVTITGAGISTGDDIAIQTWHQIDSSESYEGDIIRFATTTDTQSVSGSSEPFSFDIDVVQGEVTEFTGYKGSDLIDNELLLPDFNYAHNDYADEPYVIEVKINGETWTRIGDFYSIISGLQDDDNVYMFIYDKYENYKIAFNNTRNIPNASDDIEITILKSLGSNGNVAAGTIITPDDELVTVNGSAISNDYITVTNVSASIGGNEPEDIDEIKTNAKGMLHAKFRNVTSYDYVAYLESRSDIDVAYAWGEQEIAPSGDTNEYNKVYISVIPSEWNTSTISTSASTWTVGNESNDINIATEYSSTWTDTLSEYLEPRKMLCAYEIYSVPDLVYFSFDFGIRIKRSYNLSEVAEDIENKLIYWFRTTNRNFHEEISFLDIEEYILDTSITSTTDTFSYIKGIRNLVIRDIDCKKSIYEPNNNNNYPQYTTESSEVSADTNKLRPIMLGLNQFPVLNSNTCTYTEEE